MQYLFLNMENLQTQLYNNNSDLSLGSASTRRLWLSTRLLVRPLSLRLITRLPVELIIALTDAGEAMIVIIGPHHAGISPSGSGRRPRHCKTTRFDDARAVCLRR